MSFIQHPFYDKGRSSLFWEGVVAPREVWSRDDELKADRAELKNWGYRVKVRIKGVHSPDKNVQPDDQLPWVVISSSSAGSGHKKTGLTPGITQGSQIFGFWGDPAKKEDPIYLGTIPNNDQILLTKNQPNNNGFIPFSGYKDWDLVGGYSIPATQGKPLEGFTHPNIMSLSDKTMVKEPSFPLSVPTECDKTNLGALGIYMKELIQKIERATDQLNTWETAAQGWISDKRQWIQEKASEASEFISLGLKTLFKEIRKFVEEQINEQTKKLIELINPPDRDKAKVAKDALIELIVCLFNKMIGNLKSMVGNFLTDMLDKYINVPACAVQNFIGSLLGNTLGALAGAIDSIIGNISSLLGGAFSIAGSILGILGQIAGFLACEENQECPDTKEWSIFDGGSPPMELNLDSIIDSAKQLAADATNLVDIDNLAMIDFDNLISDATSAASKCNVGPVFCGPPTVQFWGGGGSGAKGNAIISAAGQLLGIDLVAGGLGYKKTPKLKITDNCGKGGGVRTQVVTAPDGGFDPQTGEPTLKVVQVVVKDPGGGFLTRPDGDLGGDGRVWAPADWTVVKRGDGRWEKFPPGGDSSTDINLGDDDTLIAPGDRRILEGGVPVIGPGGRVTPGGGGGQGDPDSGSRLPSGETQEERLSRLRRTTVIPGTGPNGETEFDAFPTMDIGSYPTILYLCDINIENHGINYSAGDKVVIEPSNGSEVVPTFGPFGVLQSLRIVKAGKGFIERPLIYIESETGYNAVLKPVFCVERIGDDKDGDLPDDAITNLIGVVSVVNCVGIVANPEFAGYINGKPYFGPTHQHRGVKMLGATHTRNPHPLVWDSIAESLANYDSRFRWSGGQILTVLGPTRPTGAQQPTASDTPTTGQTVVSNAYLGDAANTDGTPNNMGTVLPNANVGQPMQATPPAAPPSPAPPSPAPAPPSAPSPAPPSAPPPSPPTPPPPSPPPSPPSGGGGYGGGY